MKDEERGPGQWQYAVRVIDEDGDAMLYTSWGSYSYEPFMSPASARDFASGWLTDYEIVRTWIPEPQWEVVS